MNNSDLYNLFNLSPIPTWVFEVSSLSFLDVNVAAQESYGYTKDEFLSMTINDIRPVDDIEEVTNIVKENTKTKIFYKNSFKHLRKNGEMIDVEIASNPITFNGKAARLVSATDISEKLKAQQALSLNEKRFVALVQDGSDMITIIDEEFRYKYVSPASKKVFGVAPDFFIGKKAFAYIHEDDKPRIEQEAMQIWENKHIQLSPYRYRDLDGNWLWIETRATNLFNDPAVQGIVCTSKDVTERINNEKILQENIERYNIVSKATSDIIWDCNFIENTIIWNKAIKGILKYNNKEQTSYEWWKENIHDDDRQRVVKKIEEHLLSGVSNWHDEYLFLCGDGYYKCIYDRGFLLFDENGKAYRMIGAMQDITEKKEEEAWSKLLESAVVNASDGILITSAAKHPLIIYVNDALLAMSGYTREELIGEHPSILHGSHSDQDSLNKLLNAVEREESCKLELVNYTKQGKAYHVSITLTPVHEPNGKLARWVSIRRDVSEHWKHMNEIEQQNKKLNQISWMQSHVARAPLARIISFVELLELTKSDEERKEIMQHLKYSTDELDKIITTIANQT